MRTVAGGKIRRDRARVALSEPAVGVRCREGAQIGGCGRPAVRGHRPDQPGNHHGHHQ
ncbi:Uncharacterised protein [Mycobacterium tuberculosis]|nr:Uncharacterised protein [Mycobacterium tuberculosis]